MTQKLDATTIAQFRKEERVAMFYTLARFLSVLVVPTLALLSISTLLLLRELDRVDTARDLIDVAEFSAHASELSNALQDERDVAAGYLVSGGDAFRESLDEHYARTDAAIERSWTALQQVDLTTFHGDLVTIFEDVRENTAAALPRLNEVRQAVRAQTTTPGEMAEFYSDLIVTLIGASDLELRFAAGGEFLVAAQVYHDIMVAIDRASQERWWGAEVLTDSEISPPRFAVKVGLASEQKALLDRVLTLADAETVARLTAALDGAANTELLELRRAAMESVGGGAQIQVDQERWFDASGAYVNALRDVKRFVGAEIVALARQKEEAAVFNIMALAALCLTTLFVSVSAAVLQCRGVAIPFRDMTRSLQRIARGSSDIWIKHGARKDIVGHIAAAIGRIAHQTQENVRVRNALANSRAQIMITDTNGKIVFVNAALEASAEESMEYFFDILPDFDPFAMYEHLYHLVCEKLSEEGVDMDSLDEAHETELSYNERHFVIAVSTGRHENGDLAGYTIEWREITTTRAIEAQVAEMIQATRAGDFSREIEINSSQKFMNDVAEGMNAITSQVRSFVEELQIALTALADGDLSKRVRGTYAGALQDMADSTNATIDQLREIVGEITRGGAAIQTKSAEIREGAQLLSERAEDSASSLEQTAAAMEEMTSTVQETAGNATAANATAQTARDSADRGGEVVGDAVDAMERIHESSQEITNIVGVIDGISFQTNLLALNAAVEAARAGEAGKGFAVVATEVRTLAQRSSEAAQHIKRLIETSSVNVADGVRLVRATGDALEEIRAAIQETTDRIEEINTAAREQSTGIKEISQTVNNLDNATQQNASIAERNSSHAVALSAEADKLSELVSQFRLDESDAPRTTVDEGKAAAVLEMQAALAEGDGFSEAAATVA